MPEAAAWPALQCRGPARMSRHDTAAQTAPAHPQAPAQPHARNQQRLHCVHSVRHPEPPYAALPWHASASAADTQVREAAADMPASTGHRACRHVLSRSCPAGAPEQGAEAKARCAHNMTEDHVRLTLQPALREQLSCSGNHIRKQPQADRLWSTGGKVNPTPWI